MSSPLERSARSNEASSIVTKVKERVLSGALRENMELEEKNYELIQKIKEKDKKIRELMEINKAYRSKANNLDKTQLEEKIQKLVIKIQEQLNQKTLQYAQNIISYITAIQELTAEIDKLKNETENSKIIPQPCSIIMKKKIKMRIREKERQIEQLNEIKAQNCVLFEESIKQFKDYQQRIQNLNNEIKSKDISSVDENYLDIELENKIKDIIGKVDEKFKQSKNPAEEKDQIVNQLKKDPKNESIVAVFEAVDESSTQLIENINELQEKLFRSHSIDYDARFEILQSKDREVKNSDLTNEEIKVEPSQFQSEGNALKSIIEHKDQEIQELMKTNAQLVKTIEILKKQISGKIEPTSNERILDLEQRLTNEIKENELLKAENNQLSEANKKYKAELRKMSIEQSQLNAANNNEIMEFTERIFDLKQRLERKQQKKKILKFKINQLSEDIKNSKAELIKVSNENRELIKIISASNNEFKKSNEDKLNLSLNSITTSTLEQLSNQKMSLGGKIKLFLFT